MTPARIAGLAWLRIQVRNTGAIVSTLPANAEKQQNAHQRKWRFSSMRHDLTAETCYD